MKKIVKGAEPDGLAVYRVANPNDTWDNFTDDSSRRDDVHKQLKQDQGGLCAYCEVDLKPAGIGVADFRVEHFHPKSDSNIENNWHLDWGNLLACCHGGSQRYVVDAEQRYTSPDNSCDVPKGENVWDAVILNPLHIPASPCLFRFVRSDGSMSVDNQRCVDVGVDAVKAQNTIDMLRLDSVRLRILRKAELDRVSDELSQLMEGGSSIGAARQKLAKALMKKDAHGNWPKFFSALRCYLGRAAEAQLNGIEYVG